MDGDDEHPSSSLRHSEVSSVENPEGPPIPEFRQATEEGVEVPTAMRAEKSRNVLEEDRGRSVSLHKVEEREGETGAGSGSHAPPLAGDAEVLAREAAGPEGRGSPVATAIAFFSPTRRLGDTFSDAPSLLSVDGKAITDGGDVSEVRDVGPSLSEDGAGVRVDLAEADGSPASSLEPQIEASDP